MLNPHVDMISFSALRLQAVSPNERIMYALCKKSRVSFRKWGELAPVLEHVIDLTSFPTQTFIASDSRGKLWLSSFVLINSYFGNLYHKLIPKTNFHSNRHQPDLADQRPFSSDKLKRKKVQLRFCSTNHLRVLFDFSNLSFNPGEKVFSGTNVLSTCGF